MTDITENATQHRLALTYFKQDQTMGYFYFSVTGFKNRVRCFRLENNMRTLTEVLPHSFISPYAPALVVRPLAKHRKLYLSWYGPDHVNSEAALRVWTYQPREDTDSTGDSWVEEWVVSTTCLGSPALTGQDKEMVLAWTDSQNVIQFSWRNPETNRWSAPQATMFKSPDSPALASFDKDIFLVWKDTDGKLVYSLWQPQSQTFRSQLPIVLDGNPQYLKNQGPALGVFDQGPPDHQKIFVGWQQMGEGSTSIEMAYAGGKPGREFFNRIRKPAWHNMGYTTIGKNVNEEHLAYLKTVGNPDWVYIAWITRYPLYRFGYVTGLDGEQCLIKYSLENKFWRTFAHETCHLFGSPDEYKQGIKEGKYFGYAQEPNTNDKSYDRNRFLNNDRTSCIMNSSQVFNICAWSKAHIGWNYWTWGEKTDLLMKTEPKLATTPTSLVVAWKGLQGEIELAAQSYEDLNTPGAWQTHTFSPPEEVAHSPTVIHFLGQLWVFWRSADDELFVASTEDFSGTMTKLPFTSAISPTVATFQKKLCLVYAPRPLPSIAYKLAIVTTKDLQYWTPWETLVPQSTRALSVDRVPPPALVEFGGNLVMVWNVEGYLHAATLSEDGKWSGATPALNQAIEELPATRTQGSPTLAVLDNRLHLSWKNGELGREQVIMTRSTEKALDWQDLPELTNQKDRTKESVDMACIGERLVMAWVGKPAQAPRQLLLSYGYNAAPLE